MLPWIGAIYVRCPHEDVRTSLVKNLAEECTGYETQTDAHPELLLQFAQALGSDTDAIRTAEQRPAGRRVTDYFEFMGLCCRVVRALSAIGIGLESFVPETFTRMVAAFKDNYGMSDEDVILDYAHTCRPRPRRRRNRDGRKLRNYRWARKAVFDGTVETSRLFHDLWMIYEQA